MPLIVPVLRLAYVFLNVFETFKTLRLPPPSARNGGQPSVRAMSQRKRSMKGCMTVWIIWVCFVLYERWVETFVWLFVPFYSEIKALFILFFLLTRAKGAEPVFLHVIRPIIKPYTVPLDALFDMLFSFGDLFVLVASIPVNFVRGYYHRWTSALDPPQADVQTWHRDAPQAEGRPVVHRAYVSESNGDPRPPITRDVSTGSANQTRSVLQRSDTSTPTQQIWHPPASAYADEVALNPPSGLPTPPIERQRSGTLTPSNGSDDWRQYPAFPSAYPPTPLTTSAPIVAPRPMRAGNAAQFTDIVEDADEARNDNRQGFRQSLLLPPEPRNPGSDGDLSDEHQMKGVQDIQKLRSKDTQTDSTDIDMEVEEDVRMDQDENSETDEDEDLFNTTLRTPSKRRRYRYESDEDEDDYLDDLMLTPPRMRVAYSVDSAASKSTALSTTDNGSSLRTNSVASTDLSSLPDVPSAGKKRRVAPRYAEDDIKFSLDVPASKSTATGRPNASRTSSRSRGGTIGRKGGKVLKSTAGDEPLEEENLRSDTASRQPVPASRPARAKPQRGDSQGTIRAPPARTKSSASTRPTVTRPPSARVAAARKERPAMPAKKTSTGALSMSSDRRMPEKMKTK